MQNATPLFEDLSEINILKSYQNIAEGIRNIFKALVEKLNESQVSVDEAKNIAPMVQLLGRLTSTLDKLMPLELDINKKLDELEESQTKQSDNHKMTIEDFELIINMVQEWGLLRENCQTLIEDLTKKFGDMEEDKNV